jgi:hypothetical protein
MSRSGNCWDNAAMESFFSSLKTERVARKVYRTRDEAKGRCVRLHRALLQSLAQTLDDRIYEPYGVREDDWISLSRCNPNRVQATPNLAISNGVMFSRHKTIRNHNAFYRTALPTIPTIGKRGRSFVLEFVSIDV